MHSSNSSDTLPNSRTAEGHARVVGTEYPAAICDLGVLVDKSAEPMTLI